MINILCSTDDNYVPYCGVMLTSLFENNKGEEIDVYVQTDDLSDSNKSALLGLAEKYGQKLIFIHVDRNIFKDCPLDSSTDHVSLTAYYRIAVAELLPSSVKKVLYLDCDILVTDNIRQIINTDIDGLACGVIRDEAFLYDAHYDRLGLVKGTDCPYFNSGVLLINLDYWRENHIMEQCMKYISENSERLAFHDQDTLNVVIKGKVKYLPISYNLQSGFILRIFFKDFDKEIQREVMDAAMNPLVVHFTGVSKPWQYGSRHPFASKWIGVKNISLWNEYKLEKYRVSFGHRLLILRNELIWRLGIKKRPKSYIV